MKYAQLEDREWLEKEVAVKSLRKIASEIGCAYSRVYTTVKKFDIEVPRRLTYIYTDEARKKKSEAVKAALKLKYPNGRYGDQSANWRGGIRNVGGYPVVHIPLSERGEDGKEQEFEHILVAEKVAGRKTDKRAEVVHHIDGTRNNNMPDNLKILTRSRHLSLHNDAYMVLMRVRAKTKDAQVLSIINEYLGRYGIT